MYTINPSEERGELGALAAAGEPELGREGWPPWVGGEESLLRLGWGSSPHRGWALRPRPARGALGHW